MEISTIIILKGKEQDCIADFVTAEDSANENVRGQVIYPDVPQWKGNNPNPVAKSQDISSITSFNYRRSNSYMNLKRVVNTGTDYLGMGVAAILLGGAYTVMAALTVPIIASEFGVNSVIKLKKTMEKIA